MVITTNILFIIKNKLYFLKKIYFLAVVLFIFLYTTQNIAIPTQNPIPYLQISQYNTNVSYQAIISAMHIPENNFKLLKIKNLKVQDSKQITNGLISIPDVATIQIEEDTSFLAIPKPQLDFGEKNKYLTNGNRLFEYASYNYQQNNNKLSTLANITLYLGLTAYKKPTDNNYNLALFSYYSNYNQANNKIEAAFAFNTASSSTTITTATNTVIQAVVILGSINSTKYIDKNKVITPIHNLLPSYNQQLTKNSALIFQGGVIAKQLQLTDGIIIGRCAKLVADSTSGVGLNIVNNTQVKAHIYNHGEIKAAVAVKLGDEPNDIFPLSAAEAQVNLCNYKTGVIQSTAITKHIAIQASGIKDTNIESFNIINYGKIIGGLKFQSSNTNILTFEVINHLKAIIGDDQSIIKKTQAIVNVTNHGTIILNGDNKHSAMHVNNYIAEATSQLILILQNTSYNKGKALIYCNESVEFKGNSLLVIKGINQNYIGDNNNYLNLITAESTLTFNNKDEKTHLAVQSYNVLQQKYIIKPINTIYENSKTLKIKVTEEKVNNLFPSAPVVLKDIDRVINIINGIEKLVIKENKYIARINLKDLFYKIKQTKLYELALDKSFDIENFIDNIMPDTSGSGVISNNRINDKLNHHISQRIAVRLKSNKKLANLYKNNKLNYGNLDENLVMWTGYSQYRSEEQPSSEHNYSKTSGTAYSIGLDMNCDNDVTIGAVVGYSKTALTKYGIKLSSANKNKNHVIDKENLITNSFAIYTASALEQLDIDFSVMYSQTKHQLASSKVSTNTESRKYNAKIISLTSTAIYPLQTGALALGIQSKIKYTNINIPKRINKSNNTDSEQYNHVFTLGMGLSANSNKKIFNININYDVVLGYYYRYVIGNTTVYSEVNDNKEIVNASQRLPDKNNLFATTRIIINLTESINFELNLNFLIEQTSKDYSYAFYLRYYL